MAKKFPSVADLIDEEDTRTGLPSINKSVGVQAPPPSTLKLEDRLVDEEVIPQTPPPSRSPAQLASDIYRPLLEYGAGGLAGGAAMAATLPAAATGIGAAGTIAATGLAAGAGFAGGSALADQIDQLIGLQPRGKFFALPTKQQITEGTKEYLSRVKEGAEAEYLGQIGGKVAATALKPLGGAAAAIAAKGPEKIAQVVQSAKELGINLTPAEIVATRALGTLESVLDNLPWTSGIVQRYRLGEMQKLNSIRDKLIAENGSGENIEQLGIRIKNMADAFMQKTGSFNKEAMGAMKNRLLQKVGSRTAYEDLDISAKEAVQRYQAELQTQISSAYDAVERQVPDAIATPRKTVDIAEKIIAEQEAAAPSLRDSRLLRAAKYFTQTTEQVPPEILAMYSNPQTNPMVKAQLLEQFPGIEQSGLEKGYGELSSNLKRLNALKYEQVDTGGGKYQISKLGRDYDRLAEAIQGDMDDIAHATGNDELIAAQQLANDLYRKKLALFEDPAFKAINNKFPGAVAKTILNSGNTELISRYHALVGDELFNKAKSRLTTDVLGLNDEIVSGEQIAKNLLDLGESAKLIYSNDELTYFKRLAKAINAREVAVDDMINNPLIKTMVKETAGVSSGLAGSIVKKQSAGRAAVAERYFGKDGKKKIADAFLPELLATGQAGDFAPQTFAKQFDEYGFDTISAWYGKDFANELKRLADVGRNLGGAERIAGNPSGTGRFIISYYEARDLGNKIAAIIKHGFLPAGAYGAGAGHPVLALGGEAAFILGSRQLAKLYTSEAGKKLFIEGLMTPQTARNASQIAGRIAQMVGGSHLAAEQKE